MISQPTVSDLGEFGLIARIAERIGTAPDVVLGPGDDAAVINAPDGRVVVTTDLLIEGRHFRRDYSSGYDVGRRAAAANLADICAMGARPTGLVVGLGVPGDLSVDWVDAVADGLRDEAALVSAAVAGGDITAAEQIVISVTALGDLRGRQPVVRSGAKPGDVVVVAGRLGYAAAGLALLDTGRSDDPLTDAHRRPEVDYAASARLAAAGATSMADVSDGLLADLGHVARASGVLITVDAARLTIADELSVAATELGVDPIDWVLAGGDDHAFVATLPADTAVGWQVIGSVDAAPDGVEPGVALIGHAAPDASGHEHFRA